MKVGRMSSTSPAQEQVRPTSGRALPPADAARYLGVVTEKTLANWRSLGMGPPFVRVGEGASSLVSPIDGATWTPGWTPTSCHRAKPRASQSTDSDTRT